jgi:hypothetical protein
MTFRDMNMSKIHITCDYLLLEDNSHSKCCEWSSKQSLQQL